MILKKKPKKITYNNLLQVNIILKCLNEWSFIHVITQKYFINENIKVNYSMIIGFVDKLLVKSLYRNEMKPQNQNIILSTIL